MSAKGIFAALALLAAAPVDAHRLDEYLQQTMISVEKGRVQGQIVLVPGVAVCSAVLARIDTDGDGMVSRAEQRTYAQRVLREVTLKVDGRPLALRLVSSSFDQPDALREGRGSIQIDFDADVPRAGANRRLTFENRHESSIAAYLVNALVPNDAGIRLAKQDRSFDQSSYTLDYVDTAAGQLKARRLQ